MGPDDFNTRHDQCIKKFDLDTAVKKTGREMDWINLVKALRKGAMRSGAKSNGQEIRNGRCTF